jgi:hypothetical protein
VSLLGALNRSAQGLQERLGGKHSVDEAFPRELRTNTNEQGMFIRLRMGRRGKYGAFERYDAAVGSPPAGIRSDIVTLGVRRQRL